MTTELLVLMFRKAQAAASAAIVLILVLRLPVRRLFGAELGYVLWTLVPVAAGASLFPSLPAFRPELGEPTTLVLNVIRAPALGHATLAALVWGAGVLAMGAVFALGQWRFDRNAKAGRAGPAATGFWPRM